MNRPFGFQRVLLLAVAGALVCTAAAPAAAATCTWTGAGTDALWSTAANWTGCAGGAPQNGDDLVFPAGAARPDNENDIPNLTLGTLEIAGVGAGNTRYEVDGLGVTLTAGLLFNAPVDFAGRGPVFIAPITAGGPLSIANAGSGSLGFVGAIETNGSTLTFELSAGDITVVGRISGNDTIVKAGAATLRLQNSGNTFGDQNHPFLITAGEVVCVNDSVPDDVVVTVAQGARWSPGTDVVGNVAGEGEIALTTKRLTVSGGMSSEWSGVMTQTTPVVVERAMYFASAPGQTWLGGHGSIGVAAPSRHWFFAEGATGSFFDTYILLANPATVPVDATVTFLGPAGETFSTTKTLPAQGRFTLDMDFETAGHLPPGAVATVIDAPNELIAERSMYWGGDASPWGEAHNSFGMAQAGTHWGLAEGRLAGARQFSCYILLANSGTLPAEVQVTYLRETGAPIVRTHTVSPNTRFNIDAGADAPELNEASFGADVRVTNGVPITVERSMYWNANGVFWAGGSNAPGDPAAVELEFTLHSLCSCVCL